MDKANILIKSNTELKVLQDEGFSENSTNLINCWDCHDCNDCKDCISCKNCSFCTKLICKEFMICNEQFTEQEYKSWKKT